MTARKDNVLKLMLCLLVCSAAVGAEQMCDVRDFGARGNGQRICTEAIQKAIDACAGDGGGTVYMPPGTFLSGTLYMKSGVTLRLDTGWSPRLTGLIFIY